ncbi:MAG: hypothetical protein ABR999_00455 [Methanoregula sp.]|uniref:hypothetical protein n=1 Tax=Methanoregula sp. TaxID=2052170 RepID=UPI003D13AE7C
MPNRDRSKCSICGRPLLSEHFGRLRLNFLKNKEKKEITSFSAFFDSNITNLITILTAIGAFITLLTVLVDFLLGPNWLNVLLATKFGFFILFLLIAAVFAGAMFMAIILVLIVNTFYLRIINSEKFEKSEKILYSFFIFIGVFAIFASIIFLLLSWFVKFDISVIECSLVILVILGYLGLLALIFALFTQIFKTSSKNVLLISSLLVSILVFCILGYIIIGFNSDISNYYSNKVVFVGINGSIDTQNANTPFVLHLNQKLDAYFTKNFTLFDADYAQCHWTTNYGYFISINQNTSVIDGQDQNLIIKNCDPDNAIYWTYPPKDFGRNKPPVLIALTVEDRNKLATSNYESYSSMGNAHLLLNWTSSDTALIVTNLTNITAPF